MSVLRLRQYKAAGFTASDSDANAFVQAVNACSPLTSVQVNAVDQLVTDLKSNGLWTKFKAIYPFVGGSACAHKFNLKDPRDLDAAFRLTYTKDTNSSDFHVHNELGMYKPTVLNTVYAHTYIIPFTHLLQDSTHMSVYTQGRFDGTAAGLESDLGVISDTRMVLWSNRSGNLLADHYDTGGGRLHLATTHQKGFFLDVKNAANSRYAIINKVVAGSKTTNTTTIRPSNQAIRIGGYNNNGTNIGEPTVRIHSTITIGDGLTQTQGQTLNTIIEAYNEKLGRKVTI